MHGVLYTNATTGFTRQNPRMRRSMHQECLNATHAMQCIMSHTCDAMNHVYMSPARCAQYPAGNQAGTAGCGLVLASIPAGFTLKGSSALEAGTSRAAQPVVRFVPASSCAAQPVVPVVPLAGLPCLCLLPGLEAGSALEAGTTGCGAAENRRTVLFSNGAKHSTAVVRV
jgi:hypothetical protein